jgi:predicted transcriptional regulator
MLPPVSNDEELVRDYFAHFFTTENEVAKYFRFIDSNYLNKLFAETKITLGSGDTEEYFSMLTPQEVTAIKEKTEISFALTNPEVFMPEDKVNLDIELKNVEKLIVKLYQINTSNYYKQQKNQISSSLDLDGLVANHEEIKTFNHAPQIRHKATLNFPQLKERGVYVVELIGNGISSRALIRKGQLNFMVRNGSAGQTVTIFDESRNLVKDANIWIEGREYKPDEHGHITIPYSTHPGNRKMIITQNDFACLHDFAHIAEAYKLTGGFYIDRESLIEGKNAGVIFRPMLYINGSRADLALLKETVLTISSQDLEGVSSNRDIRNFELFNNKESVFEFKVPEKLNKISFKVQGKIDNLSKNSKDELEISQAFVVNKIAKTEKIQTFLPRKIEGEYQVCLLGLSGEPVENYPIQLEIKAKHFKRSLHTSLKTDDRGRCYLGKLVDIEWINISAAECESYKLIPTGSQQSYPEFISIRSGETISLPALHDELPVNELMSLLELRGSSYYKDWTSNVRLIDGAITVDDLPAGDYELFLIKPEAAIAIKVADGSQTAGYIVSDCQLIKSQNSRQTFIHRVKQSSKDKCRIVLKNASKNTRVHVLGTRFIPDFSIYKNFSLDSNNAANFRLLDIPLSKYLSGRNIGDEYKYILERKYARIFPGNMLKRPGLLLNPWSLGTTDTDTQSAGFGSGWAEPSASARKRSAVLSESARYDGTLDGDSSFASLNFLPAPSVIMTNLRPDQKGIVEIDLSETKVLQHLHIIAVDGEATSYAELSLAEKDESYKSISMNRALDPKRHFSEQKNISVISMNDKLEIADMTTAKLEVFDSLSSVYQLFSSINKNENLAEFNFIINWPELNEKKQLELYSKYSCHELNFFLYKKDRKFFDKVIKPYIAHKRDKTFIDNWLLNNNLTAYLEPWAFERLNIAEKILLAAKLDPEKAGIKRHVSDLCDLLPANIDYFNHLFKTALKGNALETESRLGYEKDIAKAQGLRSPAAPPAPGQARAKMVARRPSLQRAAAPMAKEEIASFADFDSAAETDDEYLGYDSGRRDEVKQLFRQLDKTEEWVENNYYKLPIDKQTASLITVNNFWRDFADNKKGQLFVSKNVAEASGSFTEMMLALAVLDLPFAAQKHETDFANTSMKLKPGNNLIAFHREIKEVKDVAKTQSILTGQNFFAQNDRYYYERNERFDKFVTEEFLIRQVYGCQVILTNPTSSRKNVDVLLQIPDGAIPVLQGFYTSSINMQLEAFSTKTHEYYFYFPEPGRKIHYPVHVSQEETMIAAGKPFVFNVVAELTNYDKTSWPYISQNGTTGEVLSYLQQNNIDRLDLTLIAFRLKDKDFFIKLYNILKARHVFNATVWSYSLYHRHIEALQEFLENSAFAKQCGTTFNSSLLKVEPVSRHRYQHKEYWPLINARVYQLGRQRKILNKQLDRQYSALLSDLKYKKQLDDYDRMAVVYYLLLQDRIEEANEIFTQIKSAEQINSLQYDYLQAYLAFYFERPQTATKIAEKYSQYPVVRWRNLFADVIAQSQEITGDATQVIDEESRRQKQNRLADSQPQLDFSIEKQRISLNHKNMEKVKINFYEMDIELLFSKQPFVKEVSEQFSVIQPNHSIVQQLEKAKNQTFIELPQQFKEKNVMIEVSSSGISKTAAYYPNSMLVSFAEQYGQLRVSHKETQKPLSKVYIKVYSRLKNGEVKFYRDGYTDLRGKFDYASLSTNELDHSERFSLLIMSENNGALVREAAPPNR